MRRRRMGAVEDFESENAFHHGILSFSGGQGAAAPVLERLYRSVLRMRRFERLETSYVGTGGAFPAARNEDSRESCRRPGRRR
jgi:hypothetical protein